jgi:type I restriction enzyme, S subunit
MNSKSVIVDLRPDHLATVNAILLAEVPDYEVWAFGSRAKWTAKDSSDLDLALASKEPVPAKRLRRLQRAFEESYLPLKVDVIDLSKVSPEFHALIEEQHVVLHKPDTDGQGKHPTREWGSLPLEECIETIIDYRGKTPKKVTQGIPLITAKIIKHGMIETPNEFISPDDYDQWMRRGIPQAGDVLLTTEAPLGEVAQLDERKVALAQRVVALRGEKGLLDNDFLKYLLQSRQVQDQLKSRASGTTVQGVKQSELRKINLTLPPIAEQRAIAKVLRSLDDKIELNRRMNETLEAIARAIFKSWFVDVTESGLPEGWREVTLGDAIVIHDSKRIPLSSRERAKRQGPYPYYGAASVMDYVDDYLFDGVYTLIGEDGSVVNEDDTPVLQYVWGKFWVNNHAHVLTGKDGIAVEHLFLFLNTVNIRPFVTGAVQPKLNQGNLCRIPFVLPPESVSRDFAKLTELIFARIRANSEESRTLAALRDALLPKLLSGEIRAIETATLC